MNQIGSDLVLLGHALGIGHEFGIGHKLGTNQARIGHELDIKFIILEVVLKTKRKEGNF